MIRNFLILFKANSPNAISLVEEVKSEVSHMGGKYTIKSTSPEKNAFQLYKENKSDETTDVIIIGGDGTINEVLNAIDDFNITLGIIPAGTGNDFYRMIQTDNPIKTAIYGEIRKYDIGLCNNRRFINGVGCAIEGETASLFEERRNKNQKSESYFFPILKKILTFKPKTSTLKIDASFALTAPFFLLTVGNGKFFGSGYKLTPKARLENGKLDLVYVNNIPKVVALFIMSIVPKGWHIYLPFVHSKKISHIEYKSDYYFYIHIDGEVSQVNKVIITLLTEKLKVRY